MPLSVLSIAYPFAPVSPDAVGGAEQVLSQLDAALVRAGHNSVVVACEGSSIRGKLVAMRRPEGLLNEATQRQVYHEYKLVIRQLLSRLPIDLIHMHGIDFSEYLPPAG